MLKIRLSKLNVTGAIAEIEADGGDTVTIVRYRNRQDAERICCEAAGRLRKLADSFERLAGMENPFHEKSHRAACRAEGQ